MAKLFTTIPVGNLTHNLILEVEISGFRWWMFRLRIGIWLIRLAARIAGMGITIKYDDF